MNRAILAGSVIVGIAVMMSISMIAPAFASPPWKDLYRCNDFEGTYEWVKDQEECDGITLEDRVTCDPKRNTEMHMEFKDLNEYNGEFDEGEQTRCHKNSFWT